MPGWVRWTILTLFVAALVPAAATLVSDNDDPEAPLAKPSPSSTPVEVRFAKLRKTPSTYDGYPNRKQIKRCFKRGLRGVEQPGVDRMLDLQNGAPLSGHTRDIGFIASVVESARDLSFKGTPAYRFLKRGPLGRRIAEERDKRYSEAAFLDNEDILLSIGAIDLFDDLRSASANDTGRDVLGFYLRRAKRAFVPYGGEGIELTSAQKMTLAHEFQHALAAQRLSDPMDGYAAAAKEDESAAVQALIEGDATLTQRLVGMAALGVRGTYALRGEPRRRVNYFLKRRALFPYADGMGFVCALYLDGGWKAINRAYRRPPTTTAEIIWPRLYLEGFKPKDPRDIGDLEDGWELTARRSFPASWLFSIFEAPANDPRRALGKLGRIGMIVRQWNGGEAALYRNLTDDNALGIALETRRKNSVMCEAMALWHKRAFGTDRRRGEGAERYVLESEKVTAIVWCEGTEVRVGIAPDLATARALVE